MKKIAIILGSIFVVLIGVLIAVPMFYSIDNLRPKIVETANKQLRGKLELGKLSFSLFPSVKIHIDGLKATAPAPFEKKPLADIGAIDIQIPLLSLISAPRATVVVTNPKFALVSQGKKSSLTEFLPLPAPATAEPAKQSPAAPSAPGALKTAISGLPGFLAAPIMNAKLSVSVSNGAAEIVDLAAPKGEEISVSALDVQLANIGLQTPMKISASLSPKMKKSGLEVDGTLKANGQVTLTPENAGNKVSFDLSSDLAALDLKFAPFFHKPAGTPMNGELAGHVVAGAGLSADISKMQFQFAAVKATGHLKVELPEDAEKGTVDLALAAPNVALAPFGTFVPMVKQYGLDGKAYFDLKVNGPLKTPNINLVAGVDNAKGTTPALKAPVSDLDAKISVTGTPTNPHVVMDPVRVKIGSTDISTKVETRGIDPVSLSIDVTSNRIDADELLGLKPIDVVDIIKKKPKTPPPTTPLDESLAQVSPVVEDQLKNPMLDKVSATITVRVKEIRAVGADFTNATFNMKYAKRQLEISKTGLGAYGGTMTLASKIDLNKELGFQMSAGLKDVRIQDAAKAHAPGWSNELSGAMTGDFNISGRGLRKEQLDQNLKGGLTGTIVKGRLSVPVVKLITTTIGSLPSIAGKKLELPKNDKNKFDGEFKTMKLDTAIVGRMIQIKDVDILYDTMSIGIGDLRFKANGTVSFDRQLDIAGTAFMSPEIVRVAELKGPSGQIEIPLKLKGSMADPKPDIGYSVGILGPRAAQNALKGAAGNAAKKAVDDGINKLIKPNLPDPAKKKLDDLKKKFGF